MLLVFNSLSVKKCSLITLLGIASTANENKKKLVTQQSPVTLHACVIMLFKTANIKKGKRKKY